MGVLILGRMRDDSTERQGGNSVVAWMPENRKICGITSLTNIIRILGAVLVELHMILSCKWCLHQWIGQ